MCLKCFSDPDSGCCPRWRRRRGQQSSTSSHRRQEGTAQVPEGEKTPLVPLDKGTMRPTARPRPTTEPIPIPQNEDSLSRVYPPYRGIVPASGFANTSLTFVPTGARTATEMFEAKKRGLLLSEHAHSATNPGEFSPLPETVSDVSSHDEPNTPSRGRGTRAQVPKNSIGIGIETEFLVRARHPKTNQASAGEFAAHMAELYNRKVSTSYPRMYSVVGTNRSPPRSNFDTWTLMDDMSVETSSAPWGIEMASPLFRAYKGSPWREEVKKTWAFLEDNYEIGTDERCSTHVHISIRRGFTLQDMKQIAQCIIHFEPAIEALVAPGRRGNRFSMSNWLDNHRFAGQNKSPRQAIAEIGRARTRAEVVDLMTPQFNCFAWNFRSMERLRTIEFRKGNPSRNATEALAWAELAMTFILSAMAIPIIQTDDHEDQHRRHPDRPPIHHNYFDRVPPNVDGLKRFLLRDHVDKVEPFMCDPRYLEPLWAGKTGRESVQPIPVPHHSSFGGRDRFLWLEAKRDREQTRYLMLSKVENASWMS